MRLIPLFGLAVLAVVASGCAAIKNDPILGDHPWKPTMSLSADR